MIPNIANFIYLYNDQTRQFDINHYISIYSNFRINMLDEVKLFTNDPTKLYKSKYFEKLKSELKDHLSVYDIRAYYQDISDQVGFDVSTIPYMAHLSDVCRLFIMHEWGGIYSDVDSIAINKIGSLEEHDPFRYIDFWSSEKAIFFPEYTDEPKFSCLCNGWFATPAGNNFLYNWLLHFKDYNPEDCKPGTPSWTKFSVQLGWELLQTAKDVNLIPHPQLVEPFTLKYKDVQNMFFLNRFQDIAFSCYQMHLWETRNRDILKVLDEDYFKESEATYAIIGKDYI